MLMPNKYATNANAATPNKTRTKNKNLIPAAQIKYAYVKGNAI